MKVEIKIDASVNEPEILIRTDKMTEEINEIVRKIFESEPQMLAGFTGDTVTVLDQKDISRIYAENGKVIAEADGQKYLLRFRLYELEDRLEKKSFVRISNSEIINLKMVRNFDLSFTGTICVSLTDGTVTYVSRRYVSKIRELLGI